MTPEGDLWGTTSPGATDFWTSSIEPNFTECPDGSVPQIYEHDGERWPVCASTGVFYAPPLLGAALADLIWPDDWSIIPPG